MAFTLELVSRTLKILRNCWLQILLIFRKTYLLKSDSNGASLSNAFRESESKVGRGSQKPLHLPQPRALPMVGTFFDLIAAGGAPQLHKYVDRRHRQLGPIFCERLGGVQDAVFVSSASLMRAVFLYEGQYPRHPLPDAWTLYNREHNCRRGLFFMEGAEWLHNRRLLNRFLLNGNLDWMNTLIDTCTEKLISGWKAQLVSKPNEAYVEILNLEQQLYRWAIDVICTVMFGESASNCPYLESALHDFSGVVHKIFESSALLMNFPPQLAKLFNLKMWSQFEENVSAVLQQGSEIIDMFVALSNDEDGGEPAEVGEELFPKLHAAGMPLDMIKRIFVDLVIAAGDTTAYTSEWALYLLSKDEELQQKIAKEVQLEIREAMLVRGLLKETLRLYPVAPFIGRYLSCDAAIGGYRIKKDTLVLLSLYTAGREAAHFPDPLTVMPERWTRNEQTGELQQVLQAHGTLPFAIGHRSCIGRKIAINQIHSLISAMASNFQLKCINTTPIDSVLRLVTVPNQPLQLAIKLREIV